MAELGSIVEKLRSKNAGPFWLTVDMFCGTPQAFETVRDGLSTKRVADAFGVEPQTIKRFEIPAANALYNTAIQGVFTIRQVIFCLWVLPLNVLLKPCLF
ncbi:MAG: DUF4387 family protein [Rhizobiales bacterium]|nr:DUF4387 family protein [Hyphomicrobiales bacterium]